MIDYLDSLIGLFGYENEVVILGDVNACIPQFDLLGAQQLLLPPTSKVDHLHHGPSSANSTYESEAHRSISTIDHICPFHMLPTFLSCHVTEHK